MAIHLELRHLDESPLCFAALKCQISLLLEDMTLVQENTSSARAGNALNVVLFPSLQNQMAFANVNSSTFDPTTSIKSQATSCLREIPIANPDGTTSTTMPGIFAHELQNLRSDIPSTTVAEAHIATLLFKTHIQLQCSACFCSALVETQLRTTCEDLLMHLMRRWHMYTHVTCLTCKTFKLTQYKCLQYASMISMGPWLTFLYLSIPF